MPEIELKRLSNGDARAYGSTKEFTSPYANRKTRGRAIRTSNIVKVNDDHAPFTKAGLFRNGGYIPLLAVKGNHREIGGKRVNVTNRDFPFA